MGLKTISIPVNDRPNLLAKVLASIRSNENWRDWRIVFSCEPPVKEATEQLMIATPNALISRNAVKLGCWANTFHAATVAMALNPTVNLYLEDDYLLSPDALAMVNQWNESELGVVICLRCAHLHQDLSLPEVATHRASGLFGCGFAWRSEMWPRLRNAWFASDETGRYRMWDHSIAHALRDAPQWRPMVNRSHGIGTIGTHATNGNDLNLFGPAYEGTPVQRFSFRP